MTAKPLHIQVRFGLAVVAVIALTIFALRETALYSTYSAQLLKHFGLASASVVCLVVVCPLIWRGTTWMRVVSALMSIIPCLVLYWVLSDRLGWHTILDEWLFGK